ncbi:MAG: hypothetical protein ACYTF2_08470, partial [Planctomycetota bacterium]
MTLTNRPPIAARVAGHAVVYAAAVTVFAPLAWMVLSSLKTQAEALSATPTLFPAGTPAAWQWSIYAEAWRIAEFGRFYGNSLFVAIVVTVLSVAHNALGGFAFAKLRFQ